MSFSRDIGKFVNKVDKNASIIFRVSAFNVFADIITGSIVGNPSIWVSKPRKGYTGGSYRMNWQTSIGSAASGELDGTDKNDTIAGARAAGATNKARLGQRIYLVNNLPYAKGIEDGTASTRGTGKVRMAALKWNQIVKEVTRKVNK